jgi:hypothetical protein
MNTKLTLRLDEALIERAKQHAQQRHTSVSQMVSEYFSLLNSDPTPGAVRSEAPTVARLRGALRGADLAREDYRSYLEHKHR